MKKIIIFILLLSLSILSGCCAKSTQEWIIIKVVDNFGGSYSLIDFDWYRLTTMSTKFLVWEKVSCTVSYMNWVCGCTLVK